MRSGGRERARNARCALLIAGLFALSRAAGYLVCAPARESLPTHGIICVSLAAAAYIRACFSLRARGLAKPLGRALIALCALVCGVMGHAFARAAALCVPLRGAYLIGLMILPGLTVRPWPGRWRDGALIAAFLLLLAAFALAMGREAAPFDIRQTPGARAIWLLLRWLLPAVCAGMGALRGAWCADGRAQCRVSCLAGLLAGASLVWEREAGCGRLVAALCARGAGGFALCLGALALCAACVYAQMAFFIPLRGDFTIDKTM